jgi:alpha-tubulin suppressor-like RCC1 family protein
VIENRHLEPLAVNCLHTCHMSSLAKKKNIEEQIRMKTFSHIHVHSGSTVNNSKRYPETWENQVFCCGLDTSGQTGRMLPYEMDSNTHHQQLNEAKNESERVALSNIHHMGDVVAHRVPMSMQCYQDSKNFLCHMDRIVQVEAGWYHTLILDCKGRVFSCGAGYSHQNGHNVSQNVDQFTLLDLKYPIEFISCGGHHSLAITKDTRQLIAFGEGRDGQLCKPCDEGAAAAGEPLKIIDEFGRLVKFKYGCAGGYHTVAIDESGYVWTAGKNVYGQVGLPQDEEATDDTLESVTTLQKLERFDSETLSEHDLRFVQCSAGAWHTLLVTNTGKVFGAGDTQYGQLSLPNRNVHNGSTRYLVPTHIKALDRYNIVTTSCGYFNSAFISRCKQLFCSGWNAYGQCGVCIIIVQEIIYLTKYNRLEQLEQ